jgi:hypothetical protein
MERGNLMKKKVKIVGGWIAIFILSCMVLWIACGAVRLHIFNRGLEDHAAYSKSVMENYAIYLQDDEHAYTEKEYKSIITKRVKYIKSHYLLIMDKQILELDSNLLFALIDVYSRQRILWWTHAFLFDAELYTRTNDEKFVPSANNADIQAIIDQMKEKREKTLCNPEPKSPQGILNERAFSSIEALQILLHELCKDYETENSLLFKSFQAETAYAISSYIGGSSTLRWYQKPAYGVFPREGFITFRYIWLDISLITGLSFFSATFIIWWKYIYKKRDPVKR